ncbi:hypothetical protein M011DRAFT_465931, partial [Sporormia fimetaria CBS 119925]
MQRPGSFAAQTGAPPPPYGVNQGYQPSAPVANPTWSAAAQSSPAPLQQRQWGQPPPPQGNWSQPQQPTGGPTPITYGTGQGTYGQALAQNGPPVPPPKPQTFQLQQGSQTWGCQGAFQQPQQPQNNYQAPSQQSQVYNMAAPPPPSQTPGGSYFPPAQSQIGVYSTPASAPAQPPPSTVISPNEQNPAYVPPSLSGQGVTSYMPANTNPLPGVYVPPPPADIPAWQHATHAPLQGADKKFRYTKPLPNPAGYSQGFAAPAAQAPASSPPQIPFGQYGQTSLPPQQSFPDSNTLSGQYQYQYQQTQPVGLPLPQSQQYPLQPQDQQYMQPSQGQPSVPVQSYQQGTQWQQASLPVQQPPIVPVSSETQYNAQQGWQAEAQTQGQTDQQYQQGQEHTIQAPKPLPHNTTTPPNFINQVGSESQPVSPINSRQSTILGFGHGAGRGGSISSIALEAIRNQRAQSGTKTSSPAPSLQSTIRPPPAVPPPVAPATPGSAFNALGTGGPSDWEHFGAPVEEVDDEELFGAKKEAKTDLPSANTAELPGSQMDPPPTAEEWPSPPSQTAHPAPSSSQQDSYQPTPEPKPATPSHVPPAQSAQQFSIVEKATQASSPALSQPNQLPTAQTSFVVDEGGYIPPAAAHEQEPGPPPGPSNYSFVEGAVTGQQPGAEQHPGPQAAPPPITNFVIDEGNWSLPPPPPAQTTIPSAGQVLYSQNEQVVTEQYAAEIRATNASLEKRLSELEKETADLAAEVDEKRSATEYIHAMSDEVKTQQHASEIRAKNESLENRVADLEDQKAALSAELNMEKSAAETYRAKLRRKLADMAMLAEFGHVLNANGQYMDADRSTKGWETEEDDFAMIQGLLDAMRRDGQIIADLRREITENAALVARLNEDCEGKNDAVKERDTTISDLRQQLEMEKARMPSPAALVPDLDPWYAGSLERYIAMLRDEAREANVEDKIKVFTAFLKAESDARGLEYHSAAPPAPPALPAPGAHDNDKPLGDEEKTPSGRSSSDIAERKEMRIDIPPQDFVQDDLAQYSPGGRPILPSIAVASIDKPTVQDNSMSNATAGAEQARPTSTQSTTVLTPASSDDDDASSTPIPSPPEPITQAKYIAYAPSPATPAAVKPVNNRQSVIFVSALPIAPRSTKSKEHDEIFFSENPASPESASRTTSSDSAVSDVPMPAPLSLKHPNPAPRPKPAPTRINLQALAELLPRKLEFSQPHSRLQEIRTEANALPSDFTFITDLTSKWEKKAATFRKQNDSARHKRQEESEARTDQLFNDNEISYAEIGAMEDEFKEKERQLKAQEDRDEYKTYVEDVFDQVYSALQKDIKVLMDLYFETEALLHSSVSGTQSMTSSAAAPPTTKEALEVLRDLHAAAELRHEKVVQAVAERDKRYKKTEIQPLYAAGNIARMKTMEKHFEGAEKMAAVRAKEDKAERITELVKVVEPVVVRGVAGEQIELDAIIAGVRAVEVDETGEQKLEVLGKAKETVQLIKTSSKDLLTLLNGLEVELSKAAGEADVAAAKAENADVVRVREIERGVEEAERRIREEFERKMEVLEGVTVEVEELFREKLGDGEMGGVAVKGDEEREKEKDLRLKVALEEARRRNGE